MRIKVDKEKINGDFSVQLRLEETESAEFIEAVRKHGAPKADIGGAFTETIVTETTDADTGEVTTTEETKEVFRLVSKVVELTKDLPATKIFKVTQYGENAEKFANIYAEEAKRRLDAELDKIKIADNFSDADLDIIF